MNINQFKNFSLLQKLQMMRNCFKRYDKTNSNIDFNNLGQGN